MTNTVEPLILDLLDWLMVRERTYDEVMDAWRTSCPRLPVWEEANDRGLISQQRVNGKSVVRATSAAQALLARRKLRLDSAWAGTDTLSHSRTPGEK
jgi:hypothetical protein